LDKTKKKETVKQQDEDLLLQIDEKEQQNSKQKV
jgi:hypothetical protein